MLFENILFCFLIWRIEKKNNYHKNIGWMLSDNIF